MIVHLDKEQTKQERRRLLGNNDVVYIIFHDMLKMWQKEGVTTLSPVELFLSAKNFANTLLQLPDVMEGVDDEMDDLEDEAEGENDAMIIMMLASAMLHAVGTHRVGFDSKPVIMAIYGKWCDHQLFFPFMDEGAKKEQARWLVGKKSDLLKYELDEIDKDGDDYLETHNVFATFIAMSKKMDSNTIKELLVVLNKYNIDHGHKYDAEINALYEKLGIKSSTLLNAEEVVMHKSVGQQAIVNAGGIGFETCNKD